MAANRSSVVRALEGVGVTILSGETPLAEGAGDESAVLESNTSPETQPSYVHIVREENTRRHTHFRVNSHMRQLLVLTWLPIKTEVVQRRCCLSYILSLPGDLLSSPVYPPPPPPVNLCAHIHAPTEPEPLEAVSLYALPPILLFIPLTDLVPSPSDTMRPLPLLPLNTKRVPLGRLPPPLPWRPKKGAVQREGRAEDRAITVKEAEEKRRCKNRCLGMRMDGGEESS